MRVVRKIIIILAMIVFATALYHLMRPGVWPACNAMLVSGYSSEPNEIERCVLKLKEENND